MGSFPKPIVVISKCLEFAPCRYDGQVIPFGLVHALEPHVRFLPVCPEVEIGLGTPRDPVRISMKGGRRVLHQPSTGRRLTRKMNTFATAFLSGLPAVDGFILKGRSPSCGVRDAKIFAGMKERASGVKGAGLFAEKVMEKFPGLAIADERRLTNPACREHFLTKLFTLADFRKTREKGAASGLIRFQEKNELLFMSYHQGETREMGKAVANRENFPPEKVYARYARHLLKALARPPRRRPAMKALMRAMDCFSKELISKELTGRERAFFLETLEGCRGRETPPGAARGILRAWLARHEKPCLEGQTFLEPYPGALRDPAGGGAENLPGP